MATALDPLPTTQATEPRSLIWVLDEHLDFAHDLCAVEALILSRGHVDSPSIRSDLAAWLTSVIPRLEAHAGHEERSGLYVDIPRLHPVFAPTIVRLRAEHRVISEGFRELLAHVHEEPLQGLLTRLAALIRIVRRHEADEDDILLEAYFADAASDEE
ncbi:hemerythrin domain-containing protein [Myxococcota bacterium]|nr:hemerythrin domain-containing protein [Myxococcota bacterium]